MERKSASWMLLLLICLTAVNAASNLEPNHLAEDSSALTRSKRRVQEVSSSAIEYMQRLRNSLADEEGRPKLAHEDDPTEVWAIQDTDILQNIYRAKPPKSSDKCTAVNKFIFNWRSLGESQQHKVLPVEKAILRAHLRVIPRLMHQHSPTQVSVNAYMKTSESDSSIGVHAGGLNLSLTPQSGGWVELNITKGVRSLWPPPVDHQVEITVLTSSNCFKRAPVYFEDPTAISLSQSRRRQRLYALQPLFLIYLSDEAVKEVIRNESLPHTDDYAGSDEDLPDIEGDDTTAVAGRRKRQATDKCKVEDLLVNFNDLGLTYIIAPFGYNAKQCAGSCSHQTLNDHKELGNNHARIMASAVLHERDSPGLFEKPPKPPCCVATRYSSMTVITPREDMSIQFVVYPHMIVEECSCR